MSKGQQEMVQLQKNVKVFGAGFSHLSAMNRAPTPPSQPAGFARSGRKYSEYIHDTEDDWMDTSMDEEESMRRSSSRKVQSIECRPPKHSHQTSKDKEGPAKAGGGDVRLKDEFAGLVKDPTKSLHMIYQPPPTNSQTPVEIEALNSRIARTGRFKKVLQASTVDLGALRTLSWGGIPEELRPMAWQLLLGYLPANLDRRVATLARKRNDFIDSVDLAFSRGTAGLDQAIWHQIEIDVPRTNPRIPLYSCQTTQRSLERILYVWAIRHPASGYVQGINDLVTPFFQVFLSAYIDGAVENYDPGRLPRSVIDVIEADTFWCLTRLLDGIQDNYIFAQPGIQRQVGALQELTQRIDGSLAAHLRGLGVEFIQFSFRWMNCMLMRELSIRNITRMWDTYMAEGQSAFWDFHLYVCVAFLVKWSHQLLLLDFQEAMMFLQALPTGDWGDKEVELLLSEAFMYQSLFSNASAHLANSGHT